MDPLSALREFTMRGEVEKIVRVNGEFRFGEEYTFPCWVETAYRSTKGNRYTLETLVHYIKNHHLKHTEYIQNTFAVGIPSVTLPDRKPLLQYLQGTLTSTDSIEYRPEDPSFAPKSTLPSQTQVHPQPQEQPDKLDLISLITSVERPLKDRQSLLECKNRDFYSVLVSATKREEDRQRMESQQRKDGLVAKSRLMTADDRGLGFSDDMGGYDPTPKPKMLLKGTKIGEGVPIILVPSAFQTLITIYNVKEFLEDGVYIPTDVKVKQMKGARPDCVTVQKKLSRDRVVTAYEVRDKPSSLKPDDWDRVVAVFVLGKEWQFKDWPFKDHVEIFNKTVIGFYMRFEDDSLESAKNVKQWNVKIISISKNKRHQDRAAALDVWERLEEFVRARSRS
ncbi:protein CDC73 homolog isoform X1 [Vigna radiata var. radiata]|uniref:Protein CDC73 homolog isoform X1 n=1 Tax=Vigna radiata var. radiata TaxID=3916 RepID=A0A3Q0EI27_VIGRR|nr:protein CDC73 homolog isoform X1 [Vigna radiata var. radiata]XP_022631687.1 protein CDC73 homolog isoform X1 [Vigna radiata var. radiata]XP_022631688.1 protein CDC73 homolog isoform X1 [Vigna radiata var. radiata]